MSLMTRPAKGSRFKYTIPIKANCFPIDLSVNAVAGTSQVYFQYHGELISVQEDWPTNVRYSWYVYVL